ncbi:hypothetical protein BD289DRAFT_431977 [Coniella lustricola]|uniref:Rhodopsin domain-containing protein n=1 Tax=Coniella lustricola TaxID=2025994 RepID=A0A2T3AAE1_9PEZI|nr:hypothetical protein BD289DRAFT_431977 [Coniella lustricola]
MSSSNAVDEAYVNYGPMVVETLSPMIALVTVVIILRTLVVWRRHGHLSIDDWLAIAAFSLCCALYGTTMAFVVKGGLGNSANNTDGDHIRYMARIEFACEIVYAVTVMLSKASILCTHWRLFPTKRGRWSYLVLGALTVGWGLTLIVINVVKCHPVAKVFDPSIAGTCINGEQFFSGFGIPNIITDGAILVIAVYQVMHLHLPRFKRASLVAVFLIGAATISAASVRMTWFCMLERADETGASDAVVARAEAYAYLWSVLEVDLCLICASIPAWGPVVSHIGDRIWSVLSSKGDSTAKSASKLRSSTGGRGTNRASIGFGAFRKYNYATNANNANDTFSSQHRRGERKYDANGPHQPDGFYDHDHHGWTMVTSGGLVSHAISSNGKNYHHRNISSSKQPLRYEVVQPAYGEGHGSCGVGMAMGSVYRPSTTSQSNGNLHPYNHFPFTQEQQQQQQQQRSGSPDQGVVPSLLQQACAGEHYAFVRKTSSILSDEVPYGSIAVKTVVEQV